MIAYARELHPAELANACASIEGDLRDLLGARLTADEIGAMLGYLEPHYREDLLVGLAPDRIAAILSGVSDDVATDVVQELPEEIGALVLEAIPDPQQAAIDLLIEHLEDTAGGRMTGQRVSVSPDLRAGEVIERLRSLRPDVEQPFYIYVTDPAGRLEGVLNLRSLITSQPDTPVTAIAVTDLVTVTADTDQEEAARVLKRYKLLSLPVVDDDHRLLGSLTADDLIDVLEDEATEDMFRQVGVHEDEDLRSIRRSIQFRLPWLLVNLVTVMFAAFVVSLFEDTVARVAALAAFLPVVAGQGGNAGIQTLTVVIRSLALGRLAGRNMMQLIAHELAVGLVTGDGGGRRARGDAVAGQRGARHHRRRGAGGERRVRRAGGRDHPDEAAAPAPGPGALRGDLADDDHRRARLPRLPEPRRAARRCHRLARAAGRHPREAAAAREPEAVGAGKAP